MKIKGITAWVVILCLIAVYVFAGSQTTSSTTASVIIDRAEVLFNDTSNEFMDASEALVWVNDGTMDIVARTHCLEDTETETLLTDTASYALADPFIVVRAVVYNNEKALKPGSLEHFYRTEDTGEPEFWFTWENNLMVYPTPGSDISGVTMEVYVVDRPTAVTAAQTVLVPTQYDRALVLYVYAQALYKDRQYAKAGRIMAEYIAELDRYRLDLNTQPIKEEID